MGISVRLSVLILGLATGLNAPPVCADADGLLGMHAVSPVSLRISSTNLAGLDTLSLNTVGLLGMDRISMIPALVTQMAIIGADAGLVQLGAVGIGTDSAGGTGPSRSSTASDPWAKLKLDDDPEHIGRRIGLGRILPDITLESGYNDNYTLENNQPIGTFYTRVMPHSSYVVADKTRKLVLDLLGDAGYFAASSKDNYIDSRWRVGFDYDPTIRIFASSFAEYQNSHDARGTGRAEGGTGVTQTSLDKWHQWGLGGNFFYGAPTARGRLEFEAGYLLKKYDTNRKFTFGRDREDVFGTARFFYRIRPKTTLVFEGDSTELDYTYDVPGTPSLDGIDTKFLTGITWQATYKTTGFAKIGYNFRTFDSDQRDIQKGLSWNVGVDWKPKSYSTVHLETSQEFIETNGTGDATNQSAVLLSWKHYWKDRFSTSLEFGYQNSTFKPDTRIDNGYQSVVQADYAFRRWLNIGASYRHQTLDSTDITFDYDQNVFEVKLDLTF